MASKSETGHAKNIASFEALISFCTGYGSSYNPSREALKIANLQIVLEASQTALSNYKDFETALKNATNARKDVFKPLKKISTRVVNSFVACGVPGSVILSAMTINRKMQGKRATAKEDPPPPPTDGQTSENQTPSYHSVSQQSFDYLIEHFDALIKLVSTHEEYQPNEPELQVTALNIVLASLKQANTDVFNATTNFSNKRIARNNIMYTPKTGLVDIALDARAYIKSIYGASSPQFKQVAALSFKNNP
jgi:hypothetical protein